MLEPSSAAKQSAIEFAHSGRTLNRKEGSGHSFWSYCLTTRLKQSNSSVWVFFFFFFFPLLLLVGTGEGGGDGWKQALRFFTQFCGVWGHLFMAQIPVPIFPQQNIGGGETAHLKVQPVCSDALGFLYGCIVKIGTSKCAISLMKLKTSQRFWVMASEALSPSPWSQEALPHWTCFSFFFLNK